MITTQELAKLAGVSQSTVSRSLNDSPHISIETREKIQELAREHQYTTKKRIKKTPQSLSHSNTSNGGIAIIVSAGNMRTPLELYLEYLMNDVIKEIRKRNFYSVLLPYDASEESFSYIQSVISNQDVKGVVIIYHDFQSSLEAYLSSVGIPHVYTQYFSRNFKKNLNIIDGDHFTGGAMAANHLLSLGHQRIGTLTHYGGDFDERTKGFLSILEKNNLPHDPSLVIRTGNTYADGYCTMESQWDALKDCTAIFAQTDLLAISVINYLQDHGYLVPAQYSVIGFDGVLEGTYCRPQLTTVIQPVAATAETSINRLLLLINGQDHSASHFFLQPKLCVRNSTAPARDQAQVS